VANHPLQDPERRHEPKQSSKLEAHAQMMANNPPIHLLVRRNRQQRTFEPVLNVAVNKPREMQCNAR
jgi:hypothetical protein